MNIYVINTLVCWHVGNDNDKESQDESSQATSSSNRGTTSYQVFLKL